MEFKSHICRWSDYIVIVIISDDETASCRIHIYDTEPDIAIVSDLYVTLGQRRKGIATKLMKYCIHRAKALGCSKVSIRSDNDDFVREWYKRLDFEVESTQVWLEKSI